MDFRKGEIIAIDKPYRMSSFGALAHIRYLLSSGKTVHLIGGCDVAMELDARRAIAQGTRLALEI